MHTYLTLFLLGFSLNLYALSYMDQAEQAYLEGNDKATKLLLKKAIKQDPENTKAKQLLKSMNKQRPLLWRPDVPYHQATQTQLTRQTELAWQTPQITADAPPVLTVKEPCVNPTLEKLRQLHIPKVKFEKAALSHVILSLSELSSKIDKSSPEQDKGINLLYKESTTHGDPMVTISLSNVSLFQVLEMITRHTDYTFDVESGVVVVYHPETPFAQHATHFIDLNRASVAKITGESELLDLTQLTPSRLTTEQDAIQQFLERSGIDFSQHAKAGPSLAFDGTQLIVTHTERHLEKVERLLALYQQAFQVEIEAKFMEVQQGALEELGVNWNAYNSKRTNDYVRTSNGSASDLAQNLRTLNQQFGSKSTTSGEGRITFEGATDSDISLDFSPPSIPNRIHLGANATPVASLIGVLRDWQVNMIINALEQHTGTDLMSAPKVTVLSGKRARITVAQVLRYPQAFGDIQSAVGSAGTNSDSSSAGVTITAGTPLNFTEKNIGVEMEVIPTVERDGRSINLQLHPKVTEFEGFVEYGGPSVAISGKTTVNVPSGFYQPIFSTREINTEVTLDHAATVVMGGLTREEVKEVHDKVPLLGDLPLIGKAFQSKGESTQKRNLLIFVTARVVSPSGHSVPTFNS